ncbi:hypothetical protein LOK49_LG01G02940 [Camellia lanceoleosa]|uniref:Uncharacterized protein n=1 Tax=Camellia lanceoleosa TaxID=1840588 RepID=A0ACC0IVE0_9ERIC|nr:hypothetical protein LOK49_LG01G02940 [Camellia lanceoleosa]
MKRKMEKNSAEKEETIEMFDHGDDQQQQQQQMVSTTHLTYAFLIGLGFSPKIIQVQIVANGPTTVIERSMRSVGSLGDLNCTQLGAEEHGGGSKIYDLQGHGCLGVVGRGGADFANPEKEKKGKAESNGTVLSTNWKEVGSKKVEGSPPNGMELKKWEY